jgi:translocation and assembly module TamB
MRWVRAFVWVVGSVLVLVTLLFVGLQTRPGKALVAAVASSDEIRIEGVSGFIPLDMQVAKLELRDREGAWLTLSDAQVNWSFTSLLSGRVRVERVAARQVEVLRPPVPEKQEAAKTATNTGFTVPLGVDLGILSVDDLHIGTALGGVDSHWRVSGTGVLTADGTPSRLKLDMTRRDGPTAHLSVDVGFSLDRFAVDGRIVAEESAKGGVVAALIGRPDLERMKLEIVAKGDRNTGNAKLTGGAGDAVSSTGDVRWQRDGTTTAITADLSAVGPGLPASPVAELMRVPATVAVEATLDDAGLLVVKRAAVRAGPTQIDATARYDTKTDKLDATAHVQAAEPGPLSDLAGGVRWRNLRVDVQAVGSSLANKPQATATLKGSADDVVLPMLGERAPPPGHVDFSGRLGLGTDGRLTVEALEVTAPLAAVKGTVGYMPSTDAADGKLTIDLPNLGAFATLANVPLGGRGRVELTVKSDKDGQRVDWTGTLHDLALDGMPPGLTRESIRLSGGAALRPDQAWRLDKVAMTSPGFTFEMSGTGRDRTGAIDLSLNLPRLGLLQGDVGGAAAAKGKVMLTPNGGDLQLTVDLADLSRDGISSKKLSLMLDTTLEGEAVRGRLKAEGDLANQPVMLDGRFARDADGGVQVPSLQGNWASASVDVVNLAVTPKGATGQGHLRMTRLEDLAPLLGQPLAGGLDVDIATEPDNAGKVKIVLRGDKLRSGATGVRDLQLDATIIDPLGLAVADATFKAEGLSGVAEISRANGTVKGDLKGFDVTLAVSGPVTNATLAAKVEPHGQQIDVGLQRFDGRYKGIPVALNAPARLKVVGQRVTVEPASLRLGGGRLAVSGVVDPTASDLTLDVTGLPLTLVEAFAPGAGIEGTLQTKARVTGALAAPRVEASYAATGLRIKRPETRLLPALAVQGTASMANQQAAFDARVSAGGATSLALKGKATLPQGNAQVTINGTMELAPFSPAFGLAVRNVTGTLRPDLALTIKNDTITGTGTIALTNATLALPDAGLRLSGGEALLTLQGDTLQVQRLRFQTARNGEISATGSVRLQPNQGFPVDLAVTTKQALLASRPDLIATASANVKITGSSLTGFDVSGPVTIDRAEIAIAAAPAASYPTIAVKEINGGPRRDAATRPPPPPPARPPGPKPPEAGGVRLNLQVEAPQAVFVRGRGLNAEVGGKFTVTGNPEAPAVLGNLTLRRGDFNLVGHRLNFTRGNVSLVNATAIDPLLDFVATTTVQGTTIEVNITGTARAPKIDLTSQPVLPQDEAMAMLLFGKPSSGLSPFELLSAAQALAELTGKQPVGGGFMAKLRGGLGLDNLSINSGGGSGSGAGTTTSVEGGRYVAPGVYVGARQGASADSSRGVVEVEVFKHTKVTGDIGADSTGKVGVKMEWDY